VSPGRDALQRRVLVLAPTRRDAELTVAVLGRAAISCQCCGGLAELCRQVDEGVGAVLLAEEAVMPGEDGTLAAWLSAQPPWSDLPVLVLARSGADSQAVGQAMDRLGNVTVLERPARISALVSAVRTALRARQRQYQIREHLERRERTETLLREREAALRDADRRKDEFLAILAHELRNPLAPIRNGLQILRMTGRGERPTEAVGAMMERQVNHMVRLVDDLLEMSRITRGKIELRRERVDVAAAILAAVDTSRPLIESRAHALTLDLAPEPLTIDGDPVRLAQIFANLLNNAAKYTEACGRITLSVRRDGATAIVSVKDTGAGIPADMLPRVFDLFTQIDRQPERSQGGLGIGLTLVKSLVELHGGAVEARSDGDGRGSEFIVRLPLAAAGATAAAVAAPPEDPIAMHRRVLVVDDNHDAAESLALLLKLMGADVHVAYSGPDALTALRARRPDLALVDIGMPGMDGHEVARRIRQQPEFRDVTLVALTGWGQQEDRSRSRAAGFDHHLIKPVGIAALRPVFESIGSPSSPAAPAGITEGVGAGGRRPDTPGRIGRS
jgi:signal transduction histidine kinase/ActR/RegA family two-component response regulator